MNIPEGTNMYVKWFMPSIHEHIQVHVNSYPATVHETLHSIQIHELPRCHEYSCVSLHASNVGFQWFMN